MFRLSKITNPLLVAFGLFLCVPVWQADAKNALDPSHMTTIAKLAKNSALKSTSGKDLVVLTFPETAKQWHKSKAKYRFMIQGGLHGDEKLTSSFVIWLANRVSQNKSPLNGLMKESVRFDFLPIANPDGYQSTYRYNARDVNLNRNFGVLWGLSRENPGANRFSEPEAKSIKYLVEEGHYTAAIDVHGYVNWIVGPSDYQMGNEANKSATWYGKWIETLTTAIKKISFPYVMKTASELGDGGAFEDWVTWSAGVPAACLEMHSSDRFVKGKDGKVVDTFLEYESFVTKVFADSIRLNQATAH